MHVSSRNGVSLFVVDAHFFRVGSRLKRLDLKPFQFAGRRMGIDSETDRQTDRQTDMRGGGGGGLCNPTSQPAWFFFVFFAPPVHCTGVIFG